MDARAAPVRLQADPQALKLWAAEDLAISVGLLRECPFHGEPYKVRESPVARKALAAGLVDPQGPLARVFNGNARELMNAVERVTGGYAERCPYCCAADQEESD